MTTLRVPVVALLLLVGASAVPSAQSPSLSVRSVAGLRLHTIADDPQPALALLVPGYDTTTPTIRILFPEHVTVVARGAPASALHLYMHDAPPARDSGSRPRWRSAGETIEYERDLPGAVHFVARATLEPDGVRIRYTLTNHSSRDYDMATAVTDPRMLGPLHDARLERTWVHLPSGFELIAAESPVDAAHGPSRYLASYTWPIPENRAERRADGITYFTKSRRVDAPFIATTSVDGRWVVASYARDAGNVWTNPELTCQHVDPAAPLPAGGTVALEVKLFVMRGSIADAFARARR